mmetsp:Transcript_110836/g.343669  ORF Transcript_110836/g.343669 Transcript_110836/m.343669 type:complete len:465 (-) Transcript_110836:170-1564(-)
MRPTLAPAAGRGILLVRLPLLLLLGAAVPVQAAALRSSLRGKGSSGSTPLTPLGNGRAGDGVSALESDNPLLATGDMPNFAAVRPEHAKPAVEARLAEGVQMLERIEATLAAKLKASEEPVPYEALVLPLEELDSHVGRPWEMLGLLKSVRESPELRTEMAALEPKVVAFWQNVSQSKPVYEALARLNASAGFGALSEARRRIVQRELVGRRLSGMGLAGPQEEEFNSVQQRLHDLSTTFADHVLDARRSWNLTLYTNESVRGIPSRALAAAAGLRGLGPGARSLGRLRCRQPRQPVHVHGLRLAAAVGHHSKLHRLPHVPGLGHAVLVDEDVRAEVHLGLRALDEAVARAAVEALQAPDVVGDPLTRHGLETAAQLRAVARREPCKNVAFVALIRCRCGTAWPFWRHRRERHERRRLCGKRTWSLWLSDCGILRQCQAAGACCKRLVVGSGACRARWRHRALR